MKLHKNNCNLHFSFSVFLFIMYVCGIWIAYVYEISIQINVCKHILNTYRYIGATVCPTFTAGCCALHPEKAKVFFIHHFTSWWFLCLLDSVYYIVFARHFKCFAYCECGFEFCAHNFWKISHCLKNCLN